MIYGIGTDICSIDGVERSYTKRGDLFASEFCNSDELGRVKKSSNPAVYLAKIFCAKECIAKAVGTGLVPEFWWDDIEISVVNNNCNIFFSDCGLLHVSKSMTISEPWKVDLSLSDTRYFVSGVCVISAA